VVYFFEGAFQEPEPEPYHLHIHVIPSFKSLNVPGALRRRSGLQTWADGWWVPYLRARGMIPSDYSKQSEGWETRASAMMEYLRANLPQSHGTDGGLTTA
jgi:diadenosine tetraphosphate (Ap4A) HIT family hydrolase